MTRALPLVVAAAMGVVWPQQAQFRSASDTVEVYATVRAKNGALVGDIRGDEFELFEDGRRRDITVFSAAVLPLSVAVVLDHSGSTVNEFDQVIRASQEFMGRMFREDRASVSTLFWDCQPFADNPPTLIDVFQHRLPRDDGSPVWSAADRAISALSTERGRRIVLLFSDGEDNQPILPSDQRPSGRGGPPPARSSSPQGDAPEVAPCNRADVSKPQRLADLLERAERESVMVYTVAVESQDPGQQAVLSSPSAMGYGTTVERPSSGVADLSKLAKRSGAASFRLRDYAEVKAAFKAIIDELHLQYLLGFVPSKLDGKRHEIRVRVKRDDVTVRAREAFVAQQR